MRNNKQNLLKCPLFVKNVLFSEEKYSMILSKSLVIYVHGMDMSLLLAFNITYNGD